MGINETIAALRSEVQAAADGDGVIAADRLVALGRSHLLRWLDAPGEARSGADLWLAADALDAAHGVVCGAAGEYIDDDWDFFPSFPSQPSGDGSLEADLWFEAVFVAMATRRNDNLMGFHTKMPRTEPWLSIAAVFAVSTFAAGAAESGSSQLRALVEQRVIDAAWAEHSGDAVTAALRARAFAAIASAPPTPRLAVLRQELELLHAWQRGRSDAVRTAIEALSALHAEAFGHHPLWSRVLLGGNAIARWCEKVPVDVDVTALRTLDVRR